MLGSELERLEEGVIMMDDNGSKGMIVAVVLIVVVVLLMLVVGGIIGVVLLIGGGDDDDGGSSNPQEAVVNEYINCFRTGDFSDMEDILMDPDGNIMAETYPDEYAEIDWEDMGDEVKIISFKVTEVKETDFSAANTSHIFIVYFTVTFEAEGETETEDGTMEVAQNIESGKWGLTLGGFDYEITPDAFEENDDFSSATEIDIGMNEGFNIVEYNVDFFKFTVETDGTYRITVAGDMDGDTKMTLYDSNQDYIDDNDDREEDWFSELELSLTAGDYFIEVGSYDDNVPSYYVEIVLL